MEQKAHDIPTNMKILQTNKSLFGFLVHELGSSTDWKLNHRAFSTREIRPWLVFAFRFVVELLRCADFCVCIYRHCCLYTCVRPSATVFGAWLMARRKQVAGYVVFLRFGFVHFPFFVFQSSRCVQHKAKIGKRDGGRGGSR